MRSLLSAAALAALVCGSFACGGYGNSPQTPAAPSPALPVDVIRIDVVGINGPRSFSPNPGTAGAGQTVAWHNADTVTHRVVLDDGELDTGDIAPGGVSVLMTLVGPGTYHCSIHPEMVGTLAR